MLTATARQEVSSVQDLQGVRIGKQPGDQVTLTVQRNGQPVQRELTLTAASQGTSPSAPGSTPPAP